MSTSMIIHARYYSSADGGRTRLTPGIFRSLRRPIRVSSTSNTTTKPFKKFLILPLELRRKIFTHALPPRRVIDLAHRTNGDSFTMPNLLQVFNIMMTCKEARDVVLFRYDGPKVGHKPLVGGQSPNLSATAVYGDDIFNISGFPSVIPAFANYNIDISFIKSIGISILYLEKGFDAKSLKELLAFKSLEEIIFNDYLPAKTEVKINIWTFPYVSEINVGGWCLEYGPEAEMDRLRKWKEEFEDVIKKDTELVPLKKVKMYFATRLQRG